MLVQDVDVYSEGFERAESQFQQEWDPIDGLRHNTRGRDCKGCR